MVPSSATTPRKRPLSNVSDVQESDRQKIRNMGDLGSDYIMADSEAESDLPHIRYTSLITLLNAIISHVPGIFQMQLCTSILGK
jgi:hypothetical protein